MMVMPANFAAPIVHFWAGRHLDHIGWLIGPRAAAKSAVRPWLPYALDNDAFSARSLGEPWDELVFFALLACARRQVLAPRWVIVPDVVADAAATRLGNAQAIRRAAEAAGFRDGEDSHRHAAGCESLAIRDD